MENYGCVYFFFFFPSVLSISRLKLVWNEKHYFESFKKPLKWPLAINLTLYGAQLVLSCSTHQLLFHYLDFMFHHLSFFPAQLQLSGTES